MALLIIGFNHLHIDIVVFFFALIRHLYVLDSGSPFLGDHDISTQLRKEKQQYALLMNGLEWTRLILFVFFFVSSFFFYAYSV